MRRFFLVSLVAMLTAGTVSVAQDSSSAYARLDRVKLASILGELRMDNLLEEMKTQMAGSSAPEDKLAAAAAEAQLIVARAGDLTGPDQIDARSAEIEKAADILRKATAEKPKDDASIQHLIAYFRTRFMLARVLAVSKSQTAAEAALYLNATQSQRMALQRDTAEAMVYLNDIDETCDDLLKKWSDSQSSDGFKAAMTKTPRIKTLRQELAIPAAGIRLHRGIALPSAATIKLVVQQIEAAKNLDREKRAAILKSALAQIYAPEAAPSASDVAGNAGVVAKAANYIRALLTDIDASKVDRAFRSAVSGVRNIADEKDSMILSPVSTAVDSLAKGEASGYKYWALLVQGISARELGKYDQAEARLNEILQAGKNPETLAIATKPLVVDASFQLARAKIESAPGNSEKSDQAIKDFVALCLPMAGGDRTARAGVEISGAILGIYRHELLAAEARQNGQSDAVRSHLLDVVVSMFAFEDQRDRLAGQIAQLKRDSKEAAELQARRDECEFFQNGLYALMVRRYEGRSDDLSDEPLLRSAVQLGRLSKDAQAVRTEQDKQKIVDSLQKILDIPTPTEQSGAGQAARVLERLRATALWQMGLVLYDLRPAPSTDTTAKLSELEAKLKQLQDSGQDASSVQGELDKLRDEAKTMRQGRWPNMREAARRWEQLAKQYPNHPMAYSAASNAALSLQNVLAEMAQAKAAAPLDLLQEYTATLEMIVERWGGRSEAEVWVARLARLRLEQASAATGVSKMDLPTLKAMMEGIRGFEKTAPSSRAYLSDRFDALRKRVELFDKKSQWASLLEGLSDKQEQTALRDELNKLTDEADLIKSLGDYSRLAADDMKAQTDEEMRKKLLEWGAWASLTGGQLGYHKGGRESNRDAQRQAIKQVQAMREQWKDASVAKQAELILLRWQYDQGEGNQVIERLKQIAADPARKNDAMQILDMLYEARKQAIADVDAFRGATSESDKAKLDGYRQSYLSISKTIYDLTIASADKPRQKFADAKTYADALLEAADSPKPVELGKKAGLSSEDAGDMAKLALTVWMQAKQMDDDRLAADQGAIDGQVKSWRDVLADKKADVLALLKLAQECIGAFEGKDSAGKVVPGRSDVLSSSAAAMRLQTMVQFEAAEQAKAQKENRAYEPKVKPAAMIDLLAATFDSYASLGRQASGPDYDIAYGLARVYHKLGRYAEAMAIYPRLVPSQVPQAPSGTLPDPDVARQYDNYWKVQQGYCQCWLDSSSGDKEAMRSLFKYVDQLLKIEGGIPDARRDAFLNIRHAAEIASQ